MGKEIYNDGKYRAVIVCDWGSLASCLKFEDLKECPFCGNDEFYTKEYVYGTLYCKQRFDGKEAENAELYDGLNTGKFSGRAYCTKCHKALGNIIENNLTKQAIKKMDNDCKKSK